MSRDSASLLDIVRAGELILQFAQGVSREQLESDVMRQSAILYQITIMGEATKRLSREFRSQHTEVPWMISLECETLLLTNMIGLI